MEKQRIVRFRNKNIKDISKAEIEKLLKNRSAIKNVSQVVLIIALMGGILATATVAPGLLELVNRFFRGKQRAKSERYKALWKSFHYLKNSNTFKSLGENEKGEHIYELTSSGKTRIKKMFMETMEVEVPKKWDGVWRVVAFDIPENYKYARKALQRKVAEMGFYPMQKSVWVHPFSCEDEINFLKNFLGIEPFVETLLVRDMPNGKVLYHFKDTLKEVI